MTVLPDIYNGVRSKIQNLLHQAKYISITTDSWTAKYSNTSFLSIKDHWVSNDFIQKTAVIPVVPLEIQHTSYIKDCILNALDDFKIPITKIFYVISDNAPNMASAIDYLV